MRAIGLIVSGLFVINIAFGASPLLNAYKEASQGSPYEALRILQSYIPKPGQKALYYFTLGLAYKRTNNYMKAIDYLRRAYITAHDRELKEKALFLRGQTYEKAGFFYEARSAYKTFLALYPNSSMTEEVKIAYARTCLSIGELVEAMKVFQSVDGSKIDVIVGKAEIFHKTGFFETAGQLYKKAIDINWQYFRDHPERLYYLAENFRRLGDKEKARRLYYFLLDSPMRQWAFLSLALVDISEGKGHDGVLHLRMALQEPPNRARINPWQRRELLRKIYLALGRAYLVEGKTMKAKRVLLKLRQDFPATPEAEEGLLILGSIYTREDKFIEAARFLREVLYGRTHKKEAIAQLKDTILRAMKKDKRAFLNIWKTTRGFLYDETFARRLISIGDTLRALGDLDAIKVYRFVLDSAEEDAKREALRRLTEVFIDTRSKEGLDFIVKRLKRMNNRGDIYYRSISWLRAIEGRKAEAYRAFKGIKAYKKTDLYLLRLVADAASGYNNFVHLYKKVVSETKGPPDYSFLAYYTMLRNRTEEALKYYRLHIKAVPETRLSRAMVILLDGNAKDISGLKDRTDIWASLAETLQKESELIEQLWRL